MEQTHLFTKILKKSDAYTLSVPAAALHVFQMPEGGHRMVFEAVDSTNTSWKFCLSTRLTGWYPKPVLLHSSWYPFVEQKGLILNDRVMFFIERSDEANNAPSLIRVRAQRKIMNLMGQDIWVDVENLHLYGL